MSHDRTAEYQPTPPIDEHVRRVVAAAPQLADKRLNRIAELMLAGGGAA